MYRATAHRIQLGEPQAFLYKLAHITLHLLLGGVFELALNHKGEILQDTAVHLGSHPR